MSRRPTLADVARLAGTSTAVVSYVVNGGPRPVSTATRTRVEEAIAQLDYRRNSLAGALVKGESNLLGLLVPNAANSFFGELSHEVETEARSRGLLTLLGNTSYDRGVERDYARAFADLNPRGLIVVANGSARDTSTLESRVVFVHSAPRGSDLPTIVADDFDGSARAVQHLLGHGFERVDCATGPDDVGPAGIRVAGWEVATKDFIGTRGRLHRVSYERPAAEAAALTILQAPDRPHAIFATTDEIALAFVRAASVMGISIPDELAIVGFDGISEALHGSVRLTTMAVPIRELAVEAVRAVVDPDPKPGTRVELASVLRLGETCGPHRERGTFAKPG
jgi:LacI family transcriptional regulator